MYKKTLIALVVLFLLIPISLFSQDNINLPTNSKNLQSLRTSSYLYYLSDQTGCRNIFRGVFTNGEISNIEQITFVDGVSGNTDIAGFDIYEETGKIVFIKLTTNLAGNIYIMDDAESTPYLLSDNLTDYASVYVKWSYDGSKILYSQSAAAYNHSLKVFKIDATGQNNTLLIDTNQPMGNACHKSYLQEVADGFYLAVTPQWSAYTTRHDLWFLSNSGQFTQLTTTTNVGELTAIVSPNGEKLLVSKRDNPGSSGINYMDVDGSNEVAITPYNNTEYVKPLTWIDDSSFIYNYRLVSSQTTNSLCITDLDYSAQSYLLGPDGNNYTQAQLVETIGLTADFSANTLNVLPNEEIQFSDESIGTPTSWEWDFDNDGVIDSYEQNPTWSYSTPGIYTIMLTISDEESSENIIKDDFITVNTYANPTISISDASLSFGDVEVNTTATQEITVTNYGSPDLTISNILPSTNKFSVELIERDISFTLASMESRTLNVSFTPDQVGTVNASLIIFSNDPNSSMKILPVSGSGFLLSSEEILAEAGFIMKVATGASFDFNVIINDENLEFEAMGDKIFTVVQFDDYISHQSTYTGVAGENSDLSLKIILEETGDVYLGSYSTDVDDQLRLFTYSSSDNYKDFENNVIGEDIYEYPRNRYTSGNLKQTMINLIFREIYQEIWNSTTVTNGPSNNYELYNCEYSLKNNFQEQAIIVRSYIYNHQMDYSHYNEDWRDIHTAMNQRWSPIGNNPTSNTNLARSFDLNYNNCSNSVVFLSTYTDNGMNGTIVINNIVDAEDYSATNSSSRSWSRSYDPILGEYTVHNSNCASSNLYLKNQFPTTIQFSGYTQWSGYSQVFMMAAFGDDIVATNNIESPEPGDDNNPLPIKMYIPVGWTDIDNDETLIIQPSNVIATENATNVQITWEMPGQRLLTGFDVFRFVQEDQANQDNWTLLTETEITDQYFTDENWADLSAGIYQYAVVSRYTNGPSPSPAFSNELLRESLIATSYNGVYQLENTVFRQSELISTFYLKNMGNLILDIHSIANSNEYFFVNVDLPNQIAPGDSLGIDTSIPTTNVGSYTTELTINNSSSNNQAFILTLSADCVCYPASEPTGVGFVMLNNSAEISWDLVSTDIMGNTISPDTYVVYYSETPNASEEDYLFLSNTASLSAIHTNVGIFSQEMFYRVVAYIDVDNNLASKISNLLSSNKEISRQELEAIIYMYNIRLTK